MARALYRTHRSRSLDEVVGQEHITDLLKQSLAQGTVSHAYLLTGPRGIGKTSVARILAHEVNKLPYSDDPHLDIIEIDAASNRRIDDIRDLRDKVRIAPVSAKYKVYIIDEVHMLTTESFNALLKTLEEPPEHAIFILATTEVHKVPATILSRTQRFHFHPVSEQKVAAHLANIAKKEKIVADDEALLLIARHGNGSFRDSIGLLDQLSAGGQPVTAQTVETTLGLVPSQAMNELVDALLAYKTKSILTQLKIFRDQGISAIVLCDQLIRILSTRANENPSLFNLLDRLLDVSRAYDPFVKFTAVLVSYSEAHKPRVAAVRVSQPVISAPVDIPEAASRPASSAPHDVPVSPARPSSHTGVFDWEAIITAAKKHNAPLSSVLARASMEYADDTLTLHFTYALHRKKLEQPQYHSQLTKLITDICGACPTIVIKDGKVMSEEAQAVAAIMGGGDPVNA